MGSTVIIQRLMAIFQVSKNKNYKEYLKANQTLACVNLIDISNLIKSCHVLF